MEETLGHLVVHIFESAALTCFYERYTGDSDMMGDTWASSR